MSNRALLIIILLFCLSVLVLTIKYLLSNRKKERYVSPAELPPVFDQNEMGDRLEDRIEELLDEDRKSDAINLARDSKNISLSEARDYVESFETGIEFLSTETQGLTIEELDEKIFELLLKKQKTDAIELVKENRLVTQIEAKDYVEEIEKRFNL